MPLEPKDAAHLWDMFTSAKAVSELVQGLTLARYLADENSRLIAERRIEIIGEAARRVSASFRNEHPEIPWRAIIAQRNFLIHVYDEVDHRRIWRLVMEEIPRLLEKLHPLLPPVPP
ncbi:MAG: DUF86 domain-containing protein [Verrucomicrobia bacterium]|nr:DUF86 domain-containing protein [Verrucomicrobiota bacterium]